MLRLRRLWSRWHGWWLLSGAAAAVGVVSLVASALPTLVGSLLVASVGGVASIATVRGERSIESEQAPLRVGRDVRRVRDITDPTEIGVHVALAPAPGESVPASPRFVMRDRSAQLADALKASGFVLVVGESTAGKTRMAFEAMQSVLPGHWFVWPETRAELGAALACLRKNKRCVLWLDDLEEYLGEGGLTAGALGPLLAMPERHTVVLATMRAHQRTLYNAQHTGAVGATPADLRLGGRVLALAQEIHLRRLWSPAERERAAAVADTRLVQALARAAEFGVAEYLAAGPELFQTWRNARGPFPDGHPRGHALVAAAVDVRRTGYHRPLPIEFLHHLHGLYLTDVHVRLEDWETALSWATSPVYSTSSLLIHAADGHYVAFDYLADAADEDLPSDDVPLGVWDVLVDFVPAADTIEVAWAAHFRRRPHIARQALRRAMAAGHFEAAMDFASMMRATDEAGEAEVVAWLEEGIEAAVAAETAPVQLLHMRQTLAWWLGARWGDRGDPDRAVRIAADVIQDATQLLGPMDPLMLEARLTHTRQIGALGRHAEALTLAEELVSDTERLTAEHDWLHASARFEVAAWKRALGEIRAAVAIWQQLTEEALPDRGVRDYLLNISSAVQEDADPQFDTAVTRWLQDLANRAFDECNLTDDSYFALFCNLAWWVGGRLDGPGHHQQAKSIAQAVVDQTADTLSPDHDGVLWARQIIAHQEGRLGNRALAFALNLEIADTLASLYGENHPLTRDARVDVTRWQSPAPE